MEQADRQKTLKAVLHYFYQDNTRETILKNMLRFTTEGQNCSSFLAAHCTKLVYARNVFT